MLNNEEFIIKDFLQIGIIDIGLHNLKEYAATLERSLTHKLKQFRSWAEEEASKLPKEEQEGFYDFYSDDHEQLSEVFPNILRVSLFVTCYSFLEHELEGLCEFLRKQHKYSLGFRDIRGGGIFRAQIYLKKVAGIDFPDQTSSWADIFVYNHIRNLFVHNDGRLDDSGRAKRLQSFINAKTSISVDNHKRIQLSKEFCPEVINTLESFFLELFKALPKQTQFG